MRPVLAALAVFSLAAPAFAQPERYELGRRLKRFEAAWDGQPDAAVRTAALKDVPKVTQLFFSFQFGEAGRTLDDARAVLLAAKPAAGLAWLDALYAAPAARAVGADAQVGLKVVVKPFYKVEGGVPAGATATVSIGDGAKIPVPLDKLPATVTVPVPGTPANFNPGVTTADLMLRLETAIDGKPATRDSVAVTRFLAADVAAIVKWKDAAKPPITTIEAATLKDRGEMLADLLAGETPETDVPAAKLFEEGNAIAKDVATPYFGPDRPGNFRISFPLGKKKTLPARLFVPKNLKADVKVPLVVALHGAGGSENLFFEGYGSGQIVKECAARGWLLVATRSGLDFTGGPPAKEVITQLAARFPVDTKKVFVVGHSMGAAQTIALCQAHPGLFAGAAALGGGGRVTDAKAFAGTPVFVGVGDQDFALTGARALAKALMTGGAVVTPKEYPGLEHLVIVREALPDVFQQWDGVVKP